jgi:hypothetical protein
LSGLVLVDPGPEILGPETGKKQGQVSQVALGVDDEGRDAVDPPPRGG